MKLAVYSSFFTLSLCLAGCSQSLLNQTVMEQRVIEQFTDALDEENEPALRRVASSRFEETAMRSEDVLSDLRILNLPKGEVSIVETNDADDGRREVIVKEDSGGKFQFHLVNDPVKKRWVVDDVMVRQRTRGTRVTKSTAEVMDLLMTLRQFLGVWESGSREEILAMTSPDLAKSLSPLPDQWLTTLTSRIASNYEEGMARKPEANLDDNEAVVKLPSKNGHILLSISRESGQWLVSDVEAHNHREEHRPGSVKRQADAINAVNAFLTAYGAEDQETLKEITDEKFYAGSLELADLSLVSLPRPEDVPAEYAIRAYDKQLTFMIPTGREVIRVDLVEAPDTIKKPGTGGGIPARMLASRFSRFSVKDVTLYDRSTDRQRSLSSIFTAPTRASLFLTALAEQDLQVLAQMSTPEFARVAWKRVPDGMFNSLPIPDFDIEGLTLSDSHSISDLTELEFTTGTGSLLSCRLLSQNGNLKIDDIQFPDENGNIASLRTRVELSIPVLEFALAWHQRDLESLQRSCSSDFNRLVLAHLEQVPLRFADASWQLRQPILESHVTSERATLKLGTAAESAVTASLVMENDYWVVDEVRVSNGPQQVVGIRETLRGEIADRLLSGSYSKLHSRDGHDVVVPLVSTQELQGPDVQQVAAEVESQTGHKTVQHAIYHRDADVNPRNGAPVTPAVQTRQLFDQNLAIGFGKPSGVVQAAYSTPQRMAGPSQSVASRSAQGVQVFGPDAEKIARSLSESGSQQTRHAEAGGAAVDMTESTSKPSGFMYFGPDRDDLATESRTAGTARITQPADAPISIY